MVLIWPSQSNKNKMTISAPKSFSLCFFSGSFGHHECLDLWVIQRKLERRNSCREERTSKLMAVCWLQRLRWFFFQLIFIFIDVPKNHVQLFFRKVLEVLENFWDFMHFLSYRFICVRVNCEMNLLQRKVNSHYKCSINGWLYITYWMFILYLSIVCVWIDEELVKVFKLVLLWSGVVQIKTL